MSLQGSDAEIISSNATSEFESITSEFLGNQLSSFAIMDVIVNQQALFVNGELTAFSVNSRHLQETASLVLDLEIFSFCVNEEICNDDVDLGSLIASTFENGQDTYLSMLSSSEVLRNETDTFVSTSGALI